MRLYCTSAMTRHASHWPNGTTGKDALTFSVGAQVRLAAPPASQVIDGAQLGV